MLSGFDSVPGWVCVGAQWTLCRGWVCVSEACESLLAWDSAVADRSHTGRKCWRGSPRLFPLLFAQFPGASWVLVVNHLGSVRGGGPA